MTKPCQFCKEGRFDLQHVTCLSSLASCTPGWYSSPTGYPPLLHTRLLLLLIMAAKDTDVKDPKELRVFAAFMTQEPTKEPVSSRALNRRDEGARHPTMECCPLGI